MKLFPTLHYESMYTGVVAGVDEVGRGAWAGPVVTAAVVIDLQEIPLGINDSKQLSWTQRENLYDLILSTSKVAIGMASVEEIDASHIGKATMLAMSRAIVNLPIAPDVVLVDGTQLPPLPCLGIAIPKGDTLSLSIAAASIIAKVTRDRLMVALAETYPHYGWEKNVGYGTALQQQGLAKYGVTPHHRKSFQPIQRILEYAEL
jgi:ribonuclease HII